MVLWIFPYLVADAHLYHLFRVHAWMDMVEAGSKHSETMGMEDE